MSEIDDLLEKLRPLDAPTYENICKWGLDWNHPDEAALSEYIIQGEVQRAIAAKGWNRSQDMDMAAGFCEATIAWGGRYISSRRGNSDAEALLKAYIACVESQS